MRHAYERFIDGLVAVGVVLTHHVADDPSSAQNWPRLLRRAERGDALRLFLGEVAGVVQGEAVMRAWRLCLELIERVEYVGPQVGKQLRTQGILAVLYAMGFILIYIAVRFDFFFSPGASRSS